MMQTGPFGANKDIRYTPPISKCTIFINNLLFCTALLLGHRLFC